MNKKDKASSWLKIGPFKTRFDGEFPCITHDINASSIALWSMRPRKKK